MNTKSKIDDEEFQRGVVDAYRDYQNDIYKLTEKMFKTIKKEFELICDEEIDAFYSDYDPVKGEYSRWGDLFNSYKVEYDLKENTLEFRIGGELMQFTHNASNEYIFDITMHQGWHGGAIPSSKYSGQQTAYKKPIIGGIPYWRTKKRNGYKDWGRPAEVYDKSPFEEIKKRVNKKYEEIYNKYQSLLDSCSNKFIKKLVRLNERYHK